MTLQEKISVFSKLGKKINDLESLEKKNILSESYKINPWFTNENVNYMLNYLSETLKEENLLNWLNRYSFSKKIKQKKVGIIMAGNIPFVGFHDLLCVLIMGHQAIIKMSSKDCFLPKWFCNELIKIDKRFEKYIIYQEKMKNIEAIICTGSDNSANYFEYYFKDIPHIIRKNRNSIAVLTGNETSEELNLLADDIFLYFGLGCRNVSKLCLPEKYDFKILFDSFQKYSHCINHHKYYNNFLYQMTILSMNKISFYDNGFIILKNDKSNSSPVSVLNYEYYYCLNEFISTYQPINLSTLNIQCIVSGNKQIKNCVKFGFSQKPLLWDYADGIDTIAFLLQI